MRRNGRRSEEITPRPCIITKYYFYHFTGNMHQKPKLKFIILQTRKLDSLNGKIVLKTVEIVAIRAFAVFFFSYIFVTSVEIGREGVRAYTVAINGL